LSGVIGRWLGAVEGLPAVAERLLGVQIENRPAADIIRLYNSPGTLFYCDPPYVHSTRSDSKAYEFEMSVHRSTMILPAQLPSFTFLRNAAKIFACSTTPPSGKTSIRRANCF